MNFNGIEIFCPGCKGDLRFSLSGSESNLECLACAGSFPVVFGIPDLRIFPDAYIGVEEEQEKVRRLVDRFSELDFTGLVRYYYSITAVVPQQHARIYTRGLLAGVPRTESALQSWEKLAGTDPSNGALLEIGCGTAPLVVAAAKHYRQVVGIDIALRWLVVAKKRLQEAGLDFPLLCACAEALPFADRAFDRIVFDSALEHVTDQKQVLSESYRVLRTDGFIFVATPNRYSLGPDPQAGIWGGGYLPQSWLAAYMRRQGAIPPKRNLLSGSSLRKLLRSAGLSRLKVFLPEVPAAQRSQFGAPIRSLVTLYNLSVRLPFLNRIFFWIGPLLHAVAQKKGA